MGLTTEQQMCIRHCINFRESATETLAMIRQVSPEKKMSWKQAFERKSPNSPRPEEAKTGEEQNQEHAYHFL
jgi:hypothetical protein